MSPMPEFQDTESSTDDDYEESINNRDNLVKSWMCSRRFIVRFWKAWESDYLLSLRERTQRDHKSGKLINRRLPRLGEVVIIHEEAKPRPLWRLGMINKLNKGKDGNIRSAELNCGPNKSLSRPLNLLYPLEIDEEDAILARTKAVCEQSSERDRDQKQPNSDKTECKGPLTRSRKRALDLGSTVFTCLTLLSLIMSTNAFTSTTTCKEPKKGISVHFPTIRDCRIMEQHQRSAWTKAAVYTRKYVTTAACSCEIGNNVNIYERNRSYVLICVSINLNVSICVSI
ncbi:unnamed protein product [Anisakis simplex]|uniref:DUF5641 domain-containing protein n=1 Tax=Anisakis simplex TaxID=6269 RepID=A0A0M3K0E1_ANISI|nr:unnamed protein product [Anisakis simplex]